MALSAQTSRVKMAQASAQDFDALFNEHWGRVYAVLFSLLGDSAEAEDLALEVFWRLYYQPPREVDPAKLAGWLYRVATNLGYNALRANKRRGRYERDAAYETRSDPAALAEDVLRRWQVRHLLARMKPRTAQLLLLRHSGFSYAEIAAILKVSPGSVGTLLARAEREFERLYISAYGEDL